MRNKRWVLSNKRKSINSLIFIFTSFWSKSQWIQSESKEHWTHSRSLQPRWDANALQGTIYTHIAQRSMLQEDSISYSQQLLHPRIKPTQSRGINCTGSNPRSGLNQEPRAVRNAKKFTFEYKLIKSTIKIPCRELKKKRCLKSEISKIYNSRIHI